MSIESTNYFKFDLGSYADRIESFSDEVTPEGLKFYFNIFPNGGNYDCYLKENPQGNVIVGNETRAISYTVIENKKYYILFPVTKEDIGKSIRLSSGSSNNYVWFGIRKSNYDSSNSYKTYKVYLKDDITIVPSEWFNTTPTINGTTGQTINLGDKNSQFNIIYQVDDLDEENNLEVIEKINGVQVRRISNAPRNEDLVIYITNEMLNSYELNSINTVQISVSDGTETIYQYYKFKKVNLPPNITIVGVEGDDIGTQAESMEINYNIEDPEGDSVYLKIYLDNELLRDIGALEQASNTFRFTHEEYIYIRNGEHVLKFEASDSKGAASNRILKFKKNETKIDFSFKNAIYSDDIISIMQFMIVGEYSASIMHVYACNNGNDENPTYEEITESVKNNTIYEFTNTTKTAENWGLKVRATFERIPGTTTPIMINGYGGAFE